MLLALSAHPPGRLLAARELLFDQVDRGRILELRRLLIEFLRSEGHDRFGTADRRAAGLSLNGWFFMRDTRSIEDFKPLVAAMTYPQNLVFPLTVTTSREYGAPGKFE
jgi:hypothetical protein